MTELLDLSLAKPLEIIQGRATSIKRGRGEKLFRGRRGRRGDTARLVLHAHARALGACIPCCPLLRGFCTWRPTLLRISTPRFRLVAWPRRPLLPRQSLRPRRLRTGRCPSRQWAQLLWSCGRGPAAVPLRGVLASRRSARGGPGRGV